MNLAWLTDIHLNFLETPEVVAFIESLNQPDFDALAITGDIGEADSVVKYLQMFSSILQRPVYFILGNHDFYEGSFAGVRAAVVREVSKDGQLQYMHDGPAVRLTKETVLIGQDVWADGRYGDWENSEIMLNDYFHIRELTSLSKNDRLMKLHALGDEAAARIESELCEAFETAENAILLMHGPPFREACRYDGRVGDCMHLPHYACKAVGDMLLEVMKEHPEKQLTVLCGHTHSETDLTVLDNLRVQVGGADYGYPEVQGVIEVR